MTIMITLGLVVALILAVTHFTGKSYKATTSLVLNYTSADAISGASLAPQLVASYMATQLNILNSKSVALRVIDEYRLDERDFLIEQHKRETDGKGDIREWLVTILRKQLDASASRDSGVLNISVKGQDPQFVAEMANAFAAEYRKATAELKVEPQKLASAYLEKQLGTARSQLETAQNRLSDFQDQERVFINQDRDDMEAVRMRQLSDELAAVQTKLVEMSSRVLQARATGADEAPDTMANPLVQNLKTQLVQAEARRVQLANSYTEEHPAYQRVKSEVDKLRTQLDATVRSVANSIGNDVRILERRQKELSAALDHQKTKVLQTNRSRDALVLLHKDVDSARQAYELIMQRLNQTNLESKAVQTDVAVLVPAAVPEKPASPGLAFTLAAALSLGTILGICTAVAVEAKHRTVRSSRDMEELLLAPLLGEVRIAKHPQRQVSRIALPLLSRSPST